MERFAHRERRLELIPHTATDLTEDTPCFAIEPKRDNIAEQSKQIIEELLTNETEQIMKLLSRKRNNFWIDFKQLISSHSLGNIVHNR